MPTQEFKNRLLHNVHCSWMELLSDALENLDPDFLDRLESSPDDWLPGADRCFDAFSVPRCNVSVVWLGESPYPREESAIGLSFYDGQVQNLFRENGELNSMGTSIRNILKAWFVATRRLAIANTNQRAIRCMNRDNLIVEMSELFRRRQTRGWLWLNAALSFWPGPNAAQPSLSLQICKWLPLVEIVLRDVSTQGARVVLLGKSAEDFAYMAENPLIAPHPRTMGFISNPDIQRFLREWRCLIERDAD